MSFMKKTLGAALFALIGLSSTPALADGPLSGKTLTISVDPTSAPFATLDMDYRTPVGLDIDIIMELKKRLGFEIKDNRIYPVLHAYQFERIKNKKVDLIAGCLSATRERREFMDFTPVYYNTGLTVAYSKGKFKEPKSLTPFKSASIAAVNGSVAARFVSEQLPGATVVEVPSFMVGIVSVAQGKVDAMVYDRPILEYFSQTMPAFNLDIVDAHYERQYCQISLGLQKKSPYRSAISKEVLKMIDDGTMEKLIQKYIK